MDTISNESSSNTAEDPNDYNENALDLGLEDYAFDGLFDENDPSETRRRSQSAPESFTTNPREQNSVVGRWTDEEQNAFLKGLELHGKDWKKISLMIPTRTLMQIRTHAQKHFKKLEKEMNKVHLTHEDVELEDSRWNMAGEEKDVFKDLELITPADKRKKHLVGNRRNRSDSVPCPDPTGRRDSDPCGGLIVGKKSKSPLRSGRWTKEEEEYAQRLIVEFDKGLLPIPDGIMLRIFLAKALNCDPMRISKKFVGNASIGKQVFKRNEDSLHNQNPEDMFRTRRELALLEKRFLAASKQITVEPKNKNKNLSNLPRPSSLPDSFPLDNEDLLERKAFEEALSTDWTNPISPKHMVQPTSLSGFSETSCPTISDSDLHSTLMSFHAPTPASSILRTSISKSISNSTTSTNDSSIPPPIPSSVSSRVSVVPLTSPISSPFPIPNGSVFTPSIQSNRRNSQQAVERRNSMTIEDISLVNVSQVSSDLNQLLKSLDDEENREINVHQIQSASPANSNMWNLFNHNA